MGSKNRINWSPDGQKVFCLTKDRMTILESPLSKGVQIERPRAGKTKTRAAEFGNCFSTWGGHRGCFGQNFSGPVVKLAGRLSIGGHGRDC